MTALNLGSLAGAATRGAPSRPALVLPGGGYDYGQLDDAIRQLTACLLDAGVQRGDRIPVIDHAGAVSVAATIAAARVGAAATLINPALRPVEIDTLLTTAGCRRLAVVGDAFADLGRAAVGGHVVTASEALRTRGQAPGPLGAAGAEDVALVLFTSGTTGRPKAVPIRHRVLLTRITGFATPFSPDVGPVVNIMCVPYHNVGGSLGLLGGLYAGNTFVVQQRFDAGNGSDWSSGTRPPAPSWCPPCSSGFSTILASRPPGSAR